MSWTGRIPLVIPNGVLQNSSDVFTILDPDSGGSSTFTVPLSADGSEPATHWGAYGPLQTETLAALALPTVTFMDYVNMLADERGRDPVGSVTAFKNAVEIGPEDGDFWDFVAGLGLQIAAPPSPF